MTVSPETYYETGVFALDIPWTAGTVGYAICQIDVMDQLLVKVYAVVPAGFGSNDWHWNGDFYLRTDRTATNTVTLLIAEDGYGYELIEEQSWELEDDRLLDAVLSGKIVEAFSVLREIVYADMPMTELSQERIDQINELPLFDVDLESVVTRLGRQTFASLDPVEQEVVAHDVDANESTVYDAGDECATRGDD